jgi:hypothetical protein
VLFGKHEGGGITQYLLESEKGLVLFTIRLRDIAISLSGRHTTELPNIDGDEAMSFLVKLLFSETLIDNKPTAHELLNQLNYIPLAITQAAAYMNRNRLTTTDYLSLWRRTEKDKFSLVTKEFEDSTRYRDLLNAIAAT